MKTSVNPSESASNKRAAVTGNGRVAAGRPAALLLAVGLAMALRSRHMLLVLDNCEQVIDGCADLAELNERVERQLFRGAWIVDEGGGVRLCRLVDEAGAAPTR